jgi:hypothetical protein
MFMWVGIDGFCVQRYSLPIHSHLVACAKSEVIEIGRNRVRFSVLNARNCGKNSPNSIHATSNEQPLSAREAGPMEAL